MKVMNMQERFKSCVDMRIFERSMKTVTAKLQSHVNSNDSYTFEIDLYSISSHMPVEIGKRIADTFANDDYGFNTSLKIYDDKEDRPGYNSKHMMLTISWDK